MAKQKGNDFLISNMDPNKQLDQTESTFEFIVLSLSKSLGMKPS